MPRKYPPEIPKTMLDPQHTPQASVKKIARGHSWAVFTRTGAPVMGTNAYTRAQSLIMFKLFHCEPGATWTQYRQAGWSVRPFKFQPIEGRIKFT